MQIKGRAAVQRRVTEPAFVCVALAVGHFSDGFLVLRREFFLPRSDAFKIAG